MKIAPSPRLYEKVSRLPAQPVCFSGKGRAKTWKKPTFPLKLAEDFLPTTWSSFLFSLFFAMGSPQPPQSISQASVNPPSTQSMPAKSTLSPGIELTPDYNTFAATTGLLSATNLLLWLLLLRREKSRPARHHVEIAAAHELGHAIAYQKVAQQAGFKPGRKPGAKTVLQIYQPDNKTVQGILAGLTQIWGGLASPVSEGWMKNGNDLERVSRRAFKDKIIYKDELKNHREALIAYYRQFMIVGYAGALLEEYIHGRKKPDSDASDLQMIDECIRKIVPLTKPEEEWKPEELKQFIQNERNHALAGADVLFKGLNRATVQDIYHCLITQAKCGKTDWTWDDLEPLLEILDEPHAD